MYILSNDHVVQPSNAQHLIKTYKSWKTLTGQSSGNTVDIDLISLIICLHEAHNKTTDYETMISHDC